MTDDVDELARQGRVLERRVAALESLLVRAWTMLVAAVLVAGALIPYATGSVDGEPVSLSVLTTAFVVLSELQAGSGDSTGLGAAVAIGFAGLMLVVLAMLVVLVQIGGRRGTPSLVRAARVLLGLAAVGTVVTLFFSTAYASSESSIEQGGTGGVVLAAGVAGFATLLTRASRSLWLAPPSSPRRPLPGA